MQRTTPSSASTSSECKGTSDWGNLPNVLLDSILKYVRDIRDLISLTQVNKHYRHVGLHKKTSFGFFSKGYPYNSHVKELMLLPDCITAPHVRAGNQLVQQVIDKISKGDLKIDALLNRAMYGHGSYLAMQFIFMLSNLGGRISLNFDMDGLIKSYREKANVALQHEIEFVFQDAKDRDQYAAEMRSALSLFDETVSKNINAMKRSYRSCTPFQQELSKEYSYLDFDAPGVPLVSKAFDAAGFVGCQKPRNEKIWYLQTDAHKEFLKVQQVIDTLFAEYLQTTSAHRQPRMITR